MSAGLGVALFALFIGLRLALRLRRPGDGPNSE